MTHAPIVETSRLRLRGHRYDDLAHCVAMWADPNVTRFIGGRAFTQQQTWARLLAYLGHWMLLGFGYWVIEEKASGAFVGEVGFADFKRDSSPPSMQGAPEFGFALASHAHGKGYATEAALAALAWGDGHLPHKRSVCMVDAENLASLRVVEKCGFNAFEQSAYNERPVLFLARMSS